MYVLQSDNIAAFDVDGTLALYSWPGDKFHETIEIKNGIYSIRLWPHEFHIIRLKEFKARGQGVVVWSAGGAQWASAVVKAFHLEDYVDVIIKKPDWLFDDQPVSKWLNESKRSYYAPLTNESVCGTNYDGPALTKLTTVLESSDE